MQQYGVCVYRCWKARGFVSRLKHLVNLPSRPDIYLLGSIPSVCNKSTSTRYL